MDVITATVERLLAAIKKPVGAVQANKILGDLHYPQLSSMLPYRFYDADSGLYVNKSTVGFMLEATPSSGLMSTSSRCSMIWSKANYHARCLSRCIWCRPR